MDAEFDKQGRILVTAPLRDHAGLNKDVVLVGVGNHIEIWSRERWETADVDDVDDIAGKLEEMGLTL